MKRKIDVVPREDVSEIVGIERCYENLANAIVMVAVEDYRDALRLLSQNPKDILAKFDLGSIERFFHSRYFGTLSTLDPDQLIRRLRKESAIKRRRTHV